MITSKVAQMVSFLGGSDLLQAQKQSQEADAAFGLFLNQTAVGRERQDLFSSENTPKFIRADGTEQVAFEKESAKTGYRDNSISRSETASAESKLPEDAPEKLEAFEEQVKEVVAEKLGITTEELTQQMETLGLTVLDLMDPSKLAGLVMEVTGSQDIGALLLDPKFQQMLNQVSELSQNLAQQLNLTPEELGQVMEQLQDTVSDNVQEALPQEEADISQTQEEAAAGIVSSEENTAGDLQTAVQKPLEETAREPRQEASELQTQQTEADVEVQGQEEAETDETSSNEKSFTGLEQDSKGNDKTDNQQTHVTYQTTTQTINQSQGMEVTQTVVQTKVNVEDILRQVSQMTRVIVGQAESSIEMQLNPENLGKVYLQVVSREGVITAQLAAQNEAVKEALESQMVVLKENMNQQGLKVEAIEVTIASHEFERNLEENQRDAAKQQQEEQSQKSGRRSLNLNNLDDMEGVMSEEESLVAKMMSEQGNRMNVAV